jgi:hypothetical protein
MRSRVFSQGASTSLGGVIAELARSDCVSYVCHVDQSTHFADVRDSSSSVAPVVSTHISRAQLTVCRKIEAVQTIQQKRKFQRSVVVAMTMTTPVISCMHRSGYACHG